MPSDWQIVAQHGNADVRYASPDGKARVSVYTVKASGGNVDPLTALVLFTDSVGETARDYNNCCGINSGSVPGASRSAYTVVSYTGSNGGIPITDSLVAAVKSDAATTGYQFSVQIPSAWLQPYPDWAKSVVGSFALNGS